MHDRMSAPAADGADATFQALREEFLEDAAEDLKNFLSYLNEAIADSRPVDDVLRDARRVAVITSLDPDDANLKHLPTTVPIIQKSASFGDDLVKALQDEFLL